MNQYLSQKIRTTSFLLMVMVVFIHSYNIDIKQGGQILHFEKNYNWFIQNFISNGLTRIAVPLFFLISGYLLVLDKKTSFSDFLIKIKKRARTLLVPYLIWALSGLLLYFVLQSIPQSQSFFTKKLIKDYTFLEWLNAIFKEPIPYQLWFLKDLIILVVLSPLLYLVADKLKMVFLLAVFCFWALNQDTIFLSSEGLLFFSTGIYISNKNPGLIGLRNNNTSLLMCLWILLLFAKTLVGYFEGSVILQMLLLKASILIGIIAFWGLYDSVSGRKNFFSDTVIGLSFFLYLFHEPFLTIVNKFLFSKLPKLPEFYLLVYFLAPLITISVSLGIGIFLKTKINFIYKILTGNRS